MSKTICTLIIKQLMGEITPHERIELENYAAQSEENRQMVQNYTNKKRVLEEVQFRDEWLNEDDLRKIESGLPGKMVYLNFKYYRVAAVVIFVLGASLAWFLLYKEADKKISYKQEKHTPSPYHQAKLTLGNGQMLNLHELENGSLGEDVMVIKNNDQLIYPLNYRPSQTGMNILETPKGNYYSVRLPDGSTAWLNSGSSIQYPNSFRGDKRIVKVQGEVYFDVNSNPSRPFIVQGVSDGTEIQVIGTRFTVKAYKDDSTVRTTLLEGKVKIKGPGYTDSLMAGEQLIAAPGRKIKKVQVNNAEQRVQGWKENKFKWEHTDLTTILEDLAHWYDYRLKYMTDVSSLTYDANFNRSEHLSKILNLISEGTGLLFKLEGTTICISR